MSMKSLYRAANMAVQSFLSPTPQTRYEARHSFLANLAHRWGMRVYNPHLIWYKDNHYLGISKSFNEYKNGIIHDRRYQVYYLSRSIKHLEGDTVECGVFRGEGSFLIMKATAKPGRTHHVFDSFEGLSEPDTRDTVKDDRTFKWKKNDLSIPEDIVSRNLTGQGAFELHKGWIPDRFNDVKDKKFAFTHIDVDLYQPTYDSLAFFYERTVPGGIIICDDYGFESCPGAYQACHDFMKDKPESIISLATGQAVIIKQGKTA